MQYQYWLSNIEEIGAKSIKKILSYVDTAEALYYLPDEQVQKIPEIEPWKLDRILQSKKFWNPDEKWEKFLKTGMRFLSWESELFPEKLRYIHNAPYSIYYKGELPENSRITVGIVGARRCSEYGRNMAEKLGERLAEYQIPVISGMARGVDSYAHIGALKGNGKTYAVLGCGADVCYPKEHKALYQEILQSGGIISEYPPGTEPRATLFPARNRIISAFSDIVVVVEAKERSGSLITADFALEQGKDIFAFAGRATDELSFGCNALIRQGAGIITSIDSFMADIGVLRKEEMVQKNLFANFPNLLLEKEERLVYSCLDLRPRSLEEISYRTGLKTQYLTSLIQGMLGKGVLKETFRNYYIRAN